MSETTAISLWDNSSAEPDVGSPMNSDDICDVAIIGAGYTGLSTAYHAAQKGLNCHVIEAQHIGYGGSGRNVGLVNAGLWLPPQDVHAMLGKTASVPLMKTLGDMPDYVFSLIEKHQIACEPHRSGTIHAAHAPKGFQDLQRRAEGWRQMGVEVNLLNAAEVADKTGSTAFYGGLLDHRAGTINPMGFARGLARMAKTAGATISTGVTAQSLSRENGLWHVRTARGMVTAKYVVIATNAYSDELWPGLCQSYTTIPFFQLSTKPLGSRISGILKENQGLWDTAPIMFSLRRDNFDRLIIGSMGAVHGNIKGLSQRWASKTLRRIYPALGPVAFESAWHGKIAMTPDHIFRIHRPSENLFAPIGYNGRGIITGTLFGQALADLMIGAREDRLPVPVTDLHPVRNQRLKSVFFNTAFAINQFWKGF